MPLLSVPGANLHYEIFGSSSLPLLLLIPGANGNGAIFHDLAAHLSSHFHTICWDRRGYSQSQLIGAQDFANRLDIDADDAHALLIHLLPPNKQAFVFGTSAGGIVSQRLLTRHPDRIALLISHEPPSFSVLPPTDRDKAVALMQQIYSTYRSHGVATAMSVFCKGLQQGEESERAILAAMDGTRSHEIRANALFCFEFEMRQYPGSELDLDALRVYADEGRFVQAVGEETLGKVMEAPIRIITEAMGRECVVLPGGHLGYGGESAGAFAEALVGLFLRRV